MIMRWYSDILSMSYKMNRPNEKVTKLQQQHVYVCSVWRYAGLCYTQFGMSRM